MLWVLSLGGYEVSRVLGLGFGGLDGCSGMYHFGCLWFQSFPASSLDFCIPIGRPFFLNRCPSCLIASPGPLSGVHVRKTAMVSA